MPQNLFLRKRRLSVVMYILSAIFLVAAVVFTVLVFIGPGKSDPAAAEYQVRVLTRNIACMLSSYLMTFIFAVLGFVFWVKPIKKKEHAS